jgi:hypothetical protein
LEFTLPGKFWAKARGWFLQADERHWRTADEELVVAFDDREEVLRVLVQHAEDSGSGG